MSLKGIRNKKKEKKQIMRCLKEKTVTLRGQKEKK